MALISAFLSSWYVKGITMFLSSWYVKGIITILASWCVKEIIKFLPSWWSWAKEKLYKLIQANFWLIFYLPKEMKEIEIRQEKIVEDLHKAGDITADEDEGNIIYVKERSGINSRVEDVIESYDLLRQRNHLVELYPNYLRRYLMVALLFVKQLWPKLKIANAIVEIKKDMNLLSQVLHQPVEAANDPRSWFRFTDESLFVDIDRRKEEIIMELDLQKRRHLKRFFLAVRGEAGIGKTTVVNQVYEEVKSQFGLSAWVTVSQSYKPADILLKILEEFGVPENVQHDVKTSQDILSASAMLRNYMVQNNNLSYIVVLDDVWDCDLLKCIDVALPSNQEGSRILMTTRNKKVAKYWKSSLYGNDYVAKRLSEEDAWELFCKRLFNNNNYPDRALEEVSREILAKCAGLPLVILAVAGLLATKKKSISVWKTVRDNLGHEYKKSHSSSYEDTKKIMLYSYHDLPYNLKACFLYFGMFPEDHDIEVSKLVRSWVAEALAKSEGAYTPEEVAEDYVKDLIERGLVMKISHNMKNNTMYLPTESELFETSVRIHDVLHEIIREKSKELDFCEFLLENSQEIDKNGKPRRFSINNISNSLNLQDIRTRDNACSIRNLLLNNCTNCLDLLAKLLPEFADCLRVLHLEESEIDGHIPQVVANLHNLRLLRLRICDINNFPELVCQLINLETLDIYNRSISKPVVLNIKRLQKLKHLIINSEVIIPLGVLTSLTELQTLVHVNVSESGLVKELKTLKRMRTLHVFKLDGKDLPAFCDALEGMTELRSLDVSVISPSELSACDFEQEHLIKSPPQKLEELVFSFVLRDRLPRWIPELHSLVCLSFEICIGMDYLGTLQVLEDLPSLKKLRLRVQPNISLDFGTQDKFKNLRSDFWFLWKFSSSEMEGN
ncbi:hypothetical protein BVRB_6g152760 [Beta vulgaris subsp. vulgaris]|nr:hypothetical protein BVRB_6g152760 [Beta vulgaris subsp. vulgaris]